MGALAGAGAFVASRLLAEAPAFVESGYARGVGPWVTRILSLATGAVPFAVFELLAAAYLGWLVLVGVRALRAVRSRERAPRASALVRSGAAGALRLVRDGGIAVFLLYALWGFNYARAPLDERLGWAEWEPGDLEEVVQLATAAVEATNAAYLDIHGVADAGAPTTLPDDLSPIEAAIDEGWARAAEHLELAPTVGARYGRVKQPLVSPLLARMSIFGVYIPFTAEATVVRGLPAVRMPFSMAHEKAHQRGIAVEAEASFLGYLAGTLADDPYARYAAASFAESQLVSALPRRERREVMALRLPGVERDIRDLIAYQDRHRTVASEVQTVVNDRYLRANRVPGGIRSYGLAARLLVQYARERQP